MLIAIPFANVNEFEARWRTLTDAEKTKAGTLLGDASAYIASEYPTARYIPDGDTDGLAVRTAELKRITCAVVKRAMMPPVDNPDQAPVIETHQNAGPFTQRERFANPMGDIYLTKAERHSLAPDQKAFTVPMGVVESDDS